MNKGIDIDGTNLSILLYADDIVILAPNESNLQCMLNCVNEWCNKWSLSIICSKSNILYFRPSSIERSTFSFNCGDYNISYVDSYKYLGIWFSEHVTWDKADRELSKSASRALECLTTRFYACGGMNYKVFTKCISTTYFIVWLFYMGTYRTETNK